MKYLKDADLAGKTVLYRPDYNVPMKDGKVTDAFRVEATYPSLDIMIKAGAKVVILAHLGRPDGKVNPEFSLRPVAQILADHYSTHTIRLAHELFAPDVQENLAEMAPGDLLLMENIRFWPEEEANDPEFSQKLAGLGDMFVLDAFACAHRAHASVVGPAAVLPSYAGLLLEKELESLGGLLEEPAHPFVVVMGGAKVSDKIDVIKQLGAKADLLLIGGAMANTFLLAKGEEISDSKAEQEKVEVAKELMEEFGEKLILAPDFVKKEAGEKFQYLDIGPGAVNLFKEKLATAKTIFWNGSLGYTEEAPYDEGSKAIAEFIAGLSGQGVTSVIAGGDTVEMITRLKLYHKIGFVSTGGGAALELLSGLKLPGVEALENSKE